MNVTPDLSPHSLTWHHIQVDEFMGPLLHLLLGMNFQKQTAVFSLVLVLDVLQDDGERLAVFDVLHSHCAVGVTGPTWMYALVAVLLRVRCEEPGVPQLILRKSLGSGLNTC